MMDYATIMETNTPSDSGNGKKERQRKLVPPTNMVKMSGHI
jgi:hypothetical protein